jgi:hypothetical protein
MKRIMVFIAALLIGVSIMAQQANLKLNLEKGKMYRLRSVSTQNVAQTVNGVQQNTSTESSTLFSVKMVDAAADFIIAEIRFDTMYTKTNAMGKMVIMNSALEGNMASSETGDVLSCILNRLSKNALYVKMNFSGKVLEIVNLKMLSDIVLKDTALITGQMAPMIKMQAVNLINDRSLKTMIEVFTNNLAGKEVKTGDTWDMMSAINSGGMDLDITTNYKLNDLQSNIAVITAESNIKASENAQPLEFSGARITYNGISGVSKSNLSVDTNTGILVSNTAKTRVSGNLDVSVAGMNMQIPMEISGESKIVSLL